MVGIAPLSALAAVGLTDLKTMLYVRRTIQICPFCRRSNSRLLHIFPGLIDEPCMGLACARTGSIDSCDFDQTFLRVRDRCDEVMLCRDGVWQENRV